MRKMRESLVLEEIRDDVEGEIGDSVRNSSAVEAELKQRRWIDVAECVVDEARDVVAVVVSEDLFDGASKKFGAASGMRFDVLDDVVPLFGEEESTFLGAGVFKFIIFIVISIATILVIITC